MELEHILIETVGNAGKMLRTRAFSYGRLEWKGVDNPVTDMDKAVETQLREGISKCMNVNFVGEEYGRTNNKAELTVYIDSIDGTKSFVRRDFLSSISVGVAKKGKLVGGCVYDFMRDIMYVGAYGSAYILDQGRRVEFDNSCKMSKISLDVDNAPKEIKDALEQHPDISTMDRAGSIALNVAQLAAGNYEGMIKFSQGNPWDIAGALYLIEQGDFHLTDIDGKPFRFRTPKNGVIILREDIAPIVLDAMRVRPEKPRENHARDDDDLDIGPWNKF